MTIAITTADATPHAQADTPERQGWMDVLRGAAMLLIVCLHSSNVIESFHVDGWEPGIEFSELFAPYRMATLMILSGLLVPRSLAKGALRFLDGKITGALYPYLLWTVLNGVTISASFGWLGQSYLWFLFFLNIFYFAALTLRRVDPLAISIVCFAISMFMPENTKYQERLFYMAGAFFLGVFLGRNQHWLETISARRWLAVTAPIGIAFALYSASTDAAVRYKTEYILPTLAGIAALTGLARLTAGWRGMAPVAFIGRHSIVYYVAHYPAIYVMSWLLARMRVELSGSLALAMFVLSLTGCTILVLLRERLLAFRALFAMPGPPPLKWTWARLQPLAPRAAPGLGGVPWRLSGAACALVLFVLGEAALLATAALD